MPIDAATLAEEKYNALIVSVRRIHPGLMALRIRPDEGLLDFEPGQYATLAFGFWEERVEGSQEESERQKQKHDRLARRPQSFSHPILTEDRNRLLQPDELNHHEFLMNLVTHSPEGIRPPEFTPRLYHPAIREGSRIFCDRKVKGAYTLDLEDLSTDRHLVFVSTGTGEAPHNAMIWELLRTGYEGPITSIVSVRREADLAYRPIHESLESLYGNYTHVWLTTEEETSGSGKMAVQEFIQDGGFEARIGRKPDPENFSFFLCGSDSLIGVPGIERETRRKIYPKDRVTGQGGLIELLETRFGFQTDSVVKGQGERGNIHFEKWY